MKKAMPMKPMAAATPAQASNAGVMPGPVVPQVKPKPVAPIAAYPPVMPKQSMKGSNNKLPPAARHSGRGFSKTAK